ncbi:MAG TPA: PQQ-binding-like beta-propeller repeat protein [archaeon]|nr:PQQ-binding-like beta-propeller repeat protein [archaeon]
MVAWWLKIILFGVMILAMSQPGIAAEIVLDNGQHHLGDDFKDDLIPHEPEGIDYTVDFNLNNSAQINSARLKLDARSIVPEASDEFLDKVYLNDIEIATLNDYIPAQISDDELIRITFSVDPAYFKNGTNTIRITSGTNLNGTNYDDFEFSNLSIHLVETEPVTLEPPLKVAWTYELSDWVSQQEPAIIQIIEENILYLNDEGIKAIDADSGVLLWKNGQNANLNYDDGVLYALHLPTIDAIDAKSGKILWSQNYQMAWDDMVPDGESRWGYSTISADSLYVSTPSDKYVFAIDATNGNLKWVYELNTTEFGAGGDNYYSLSNPAIIDDIVIFKYYVSHLSYTGPPIEINPDEPEPEPEQPITKEGLIALSAKTGEIVWEYTDQVSNKLYYNNLIYTDNLVYTGFSDGNIIALSADSGEYVWKINVGDRIHSIVAESGKLFIGYIIETNVLYSEKSAVVDAMSGEILPDVPDSIVGQESVIAGEYLYAASYGKNNINIFDVKTGERIWAGGKTEGYAVSKPMVYKDKLFLTSIDGKLYAFEHGDGPFVLDSAHIYLATASILFLIIGMVFYWKRKSVNNIFHGRDFKNNLKFSGILAIIIHILMVFGSGEMHSLYYYSFIFSALLLGVIIVGTITGVLSSTKIKSKFIIGFLIGATPYLLLAFLLIYYLIVESKYGYANVSENWGVLGVFILLIYTLVSGISGSVLGYILGRFVLKENN